MERSAMPAAKKRAIEILMRERVSNEGPEREVNALLSVSRIACLVATNATYRSIHIRSA